MQWILYSESITPHEKLWGTSRLSHEELSILSGIVDIREKKQFRKDTLSNIESISALYIREKHISIEEKSLTRKLGISKIREKISPLDSLLRELRLIKTEEEIAHIREAIRVTHKVYDTIRTNIKPQMYEYEIEALVA